VLSVTLDSFEIDDGWDNSAVEFWAVDPVKFPDGFSATRNRVEAAGSKLGLWISPLGGYDPGFTNRIQRARNDGLIPPDAWLDLSYPSTTTGFLNECVMMVQSNAANYFKWDRATDGSVPHTMALLRLADELHHQSPQVYVNATVGTGHRRSGSNHLDCTWRGDTDLGDEGVGTTRERRDHVP